MNCSEKILEIIEYIEAHIEEELTLEKLAKKFYYSKFYFSKMFKTLLGENIIDYQFKRKMTIAAEQLLNSNMKIIDIAVLHNYKSQEAFTRSFKSYFGITPNAYRKGKCPYYNLYKYPIGKRDIEQLFFSNKVYSYTIEKIAAIEIVGLSYKGKNEKHEVPKLFNRIIDELDLRNIYEYTDGLYGFEYAEFMNKGVSDFTIIAGVRKEYLKSEHIYNDNLTSITIPSGNYAVFTLTSNIERIPRQIDEIWIHMMKDEEYICDDNYGFEYYPKKFIPNKEKCVAKLYLPVKKRTI